jgi:hypothetical protein
MSVIGDDVKTSTHLQNFINPLLAPLKCSLDISRHGHRTRECGSRAPGFHQSNELAVVDDFERAVAFGTPPSNMSPIICFIRKQ